MEAIDDGIRTCVVGSGALGLVAIKNLAEQGIHVQAFEKNPYVGGLWHFTQDAHQTSALPGTTAQFSKYFSAYTDFPMPDSYPTYPSAKQYEQYLESYANHFDLLRHIQLETVVTRIRRHVDDNAWLVFTKHVRTNREEVRQFSKIVLAMGINSTKNLPTIEGVEKFPGEIVHSQQLKDPNRYGGQTLMVVGAGPTAADTLKFLERAGVKKLYLSHRNPFVILPQTIRGNPLDHYICRRVANLFRLVAQISPRIACALAKRICRSVQDAAYPFLSSQLALQSPSSYSGACFPQGVIISDSLPYQLRDGVVELVSEIARLEDSHSIFLRDGTCVSNIDAIIFCTGYCQSFNIIDGPGDPSDPRFATDAFQKFKTAKFRKANETYPRLYYGLLSEQYPDSLSVLGHLLTFNSALSQYDLVTMALASLWSGSYPLPSQQTMRREIDKHYKFVVATLQRGAMPYLGYRINEREVYKWLNIVAGTGVVENLGIRHWAGWKFWWRHKTLHQMILYGPNTPTTYRLFDVGRGRKPWQGARRHIERTYEEVVKSGICQGQQAAGRTGSTRAS